MRPVNLNLLEPALDTRVKLPRTATYRVHRGLRRFDRVCFTQLRPTLRPVVARATVKVTVEGVVSLYETLVPTGARRAMLPPDFAARNDRGRTFSELNLAGAVT